MGEGREGDWECSGCRNRNYAFRSFCNRCKQPRLLVDPKTPADSKWLPRIGDWICTGCTNNNYASREKCKKCGQPKEVAAMPAIAMLGASLPTYANYFARAQGGPEQKMNLGLYGNGVLPNSLPMGSNWSMGGAANYGVQATSTWPLGSGLPYASPAAQIIPKGWRNGDWMCNCGFHNYSSRAQCKKCNACMPPALGTKRLATEELANSWDNKRLNAGQTNANQLSHVGFDQAASSLGDQTAGIYAPFPPATLEGTSNSQVNVPLPELATVPTHLGNGSRQWRDGDWMCSNCNNHNYASRSQCNKCKTQREGHAQPVGVA